MKIDKNQKIRDVAGEHVVIRIGNGVADMTEVIGLNESAMELYNAFKASEFTLDDVVRRLTAVYDVDEATARRDAEAWVTSMREQRLIVD